MSQSFGTHAELKALGVVKRLSGDLDIAVLLGDPPVYVRPALESLGFQDRISATVWNIPEGATRLGFRAGATTFRLFMCTGKMIGSGWRETETERERCIYIYTYSYTYTCAHIYIYIYIYMCIHT